MDLIRIFDTTLRDGEQAPGFSMSAPEKIRIARQLESLGVDVIEAFGRRACRSVRNPQLHGGGAGTR